MAKKKAKPDRKRLFRAALALAGMTQRQWAETQTLTEMHVSMVLNGKRDSDRLNDAMDEFITEQFGYRPLPRAG